MKKYSPEIKAFIAANVKGRTCKELVELVNRKFGTDFTETRMKSYKANNKLQSGTKGGNPPGESKVFPREVQQFISAHAIGIGNQELADLVNKQFSIEYTRLQIKTFKSNHHISSGLDGRFRKGTVPANKGKKMPAHVYEKCKNTMFKKGNVPQNHKPVGSERTDVKDGYRLVKVAEPNVWKLKHVVLWEQYNGPVPEGHKLVFLDSNRENITLGNIALVTSAEMLELNRSGLRSDIPEVTQVGITLAKTKRAIIENKKAVRDAR